MELDICWIKSPLKRSYHLSLGTIHEFDSIVVLINSDQGIYWGEATALPGYSWETAESMWEAVTDCCDASSSLRELRAKSLLLSERQPFAASPILTAIEKYLDLSKIYEYSGLTNDNISIPLVGIVNGILPDELYLNGNKLMDEGYNILKVKLLGQLNKDIDRVKAVQETVRPGIKLRFDANQSYDHLMLRKLLEIIEPDNTELLEQPFKANRWDLVQELVKWSPVPVMLDESIWTVHDLQIASEIGVPFVKLKLVKHGGMLKSIKMIKNAKKMGFKIILGNGVQTDLGCVDEAVLYKIGQLKCAGEMNGFLKLKHRIAKGDIRVVNGVMKVSLKDIKLNLGKPSGNNIFKIFTKSVS